MTQNSVPLTVELCWYYAGWWQMDKQTNRRTSLSTLFTPSCRYHHDTIPFNIIYLFI